MLREPPLTLRLVTANLKARSAILVRVYAGKPFILLGKPQRGRTACYQGEFLDGLRNTTIRLGKYPEPFFQSFD